MKDTEYTYAVAKIRANEPRLVKKDLLDRLVAEPTAEKAIDLLSDAGIDLSDGRGLEELRLEAFGLVTEISPDKHILDFLLAKNDLHNIKAAIKSFFADADPEAMYILPTTLDTKTLFETVSSKRFSTLPPRLEKPSEQAYDLLVRTLDGQLCDILLDRSALEETLYRAKASENTFIIGVAEHTVASADIRIALRCARTGREEQFIRNALCECGLLDVSKLARSAARGEDELCSHLSQCGYGAAAEAIRRSDAAFEKWCDDFVTESTEDARFVSFGPEPLVAYVLAVEAELKNLRMIISCKRAGVPPEEIKERERVLYV